MLRPLLLIAGLVLPFTCLPVRALDAVDTAYAPVIRSHGTVQGGLWHPPSSKYYVALRGDKLNGQPLATSLTRFNVDGTWDSGYVPVVNGLITTLSLQPDGKILIGGNFTTVQGHTSPKVARLLATGAVDTSFSTVGFPLAADIRAFATAANGDIYVGSSQMPTQNRDNSFVWPTILRKLDPNGAFVASYTPPVFSIPGVSVNFRDTIQISAILPLASGDILVAGNFGQAGSTARTGLARLNSAGALDPAFDPVFTVQASPPYSPGSTTTFVAALAPAPDGKIYAGGRFTKVDGITRNHLVLLDEAGEVDPAFSVSFEQFFIYPAPASVDRMEVDPSGRLVVMGNFTRVNNVVRYNFARFDASGSLDTSFNFSGTPRTSGNFALGGDGKILACWASLTSSNGTLLSQAELLAENGSILDGAFQLDLRNRRRAEVVVPRPGKGPLLASLWMKEVAGVTTGSLVATTELGAIDPTFNPQIVPAGSVSSALALPDGRILISGNFQTVGGLPRPNLALIEVDGSPVPEFDLGSGPNTSINILRLLPSGKVLAGGSFTTINGQPRIRLALIDPAAVSRVAGLKVEEILEARYGTTTVQADVLQIVAANLVAGKVIQPVSTAALGIDPAPGQAKTLTVRYRTNLGEFTRQATDTTSLKLPDPGLDSGLVSNEFQPDLQNAFFNDVAAQSDGKVLILGMGIRVGTVSAHNLIRLNPDGSWDTSFDPAPLFSTFLTSRLLVDSADRIHVGGSALVRSGTSVEKSIVRLTPAGAIDTGFSCPDFISDVQDMKLDAGGGIWCCGDFRAYSSSPTSQRNRVARLQANGTLDTSFDAGDSADSAIDNLDLQAPDKLWLRGSFSNFQNQPRDGVALIRLQTKVKPLAKVTPSSLTVTDGATAVFRLANAGSGETYQWFRDNVPVPGATSPYLELANLMPAATQTYRADVTNVAGTISSTGTLFVRESTLSEWLAERGIFTAHGTEDSDGDGSSNQAEYLARTNPLDGSSAFCTKVESLPGAVRLRWSTFPGRQYVIEQSTNLASWISVGTLITGDGTEKTVDLPYIAGETGGGYWRVRVIKP